VSYVTEKAAVRVKFFAGLSCLMSGMFEKAEQTNPAEPCAGLVNRIGTPAVHDDLTRPRHGRTRLATLSVELDWPLLATR